MKGLKNRDLDYFGRKILKKTFLGVFSSDLYPSKRKKKMFFLIFNLSKHYQKGSHFIAIAKLGKKVIYFDPLGKKCTNIGILKYLLDLKLKIKYNKTKIQSDESIFCGFFCLAFLISMYNKNSLSLFMKMFSLTNLPNNDKIAVDYILSQINESKTFYF